MKIRIILTVLFSCGLFSNAAIACRNVSKEEGAALHVKHIAQAKSEALALRTEADLVFVGRLAQLTSRDELGPVEKGFQHPLQISEVVFDRVENIKGSYADGQALNFSISTNLVEVSCQIKFRNQRMPTENSVGQRFLVYAKGGTILRTNHIPMVREVLSGHEEEFVVRYTQE